ncbi:MAG: peptidase M14 [Candidatus Bostrichicola ureolyticus]|nr:MAG: peptidase M14 [Candidatus Bostrichicola ureolyticus]
MIFDIIYLDKYYDIFKEHTITSRIFRHSELLIQLEKYSNKCIIDLIGHSIEKREIYKLQLGLGKKKIMIWSQMHGNETTGTIAMFDVLRYLNEDNSLTNFLKEKLNISYIPILNPDGSEIFKRNNAIDIDLNRDARALKSPESNILFNNIKSLNPDILFNLHDQKSIYNVGDTHKPAVLSFLAPSEDKKRTITYYRKKTMNIINFIEKNIKIILPGMIGRYYDEFYPTATGDNLQRMGYPCVLFEAGYYLNDWQKIKVRKYNAIAILAGLFYLANEENIEQDYRYYFSIPENSKNLIDIIYKNVKIRKKGMEFSVDIGIMYEEKYNIDTNTIDFIPKIIEIGDLKYFFCRTEVKAYGKNYIGQYGKTYPNIGEVANFQLI